MTVVEQAKQKQNFYEMEKMANANLFHFKEKALALPRHTFCKGKKTRK
jgi:hypothetical protein